MMHPDAKVEKVYLYPKPVDFRKSIDGLAALVELDIKVAVFDRKRSMNPTYSKIGGALSGAMRTSSSKAVRLRNLQPRLPVAGVQVRGAATHRALGRWL